jgi:hypothetical protein
MGNERAQAVAELLSMVPDFPMALTDQALLSLDPRERMALFDKALASDPDPCTRDYILMHVAQTKGRLGKKDEAREQLTALLENPATNPDVAESVRMDHERRLEELTSPRRSLYRVFPDTHGELPISGGWGMTREDACVIEKKDPMALPDEAFSGLDIQQHFIEEAIYFDLITGAKTENRHAGIRWNMLDTAIVRENGRVFEHMTMGITAFFETDWDTLKSEWEGENGHGSPSFDEEAHTKKRNSCERTLKRDFWFDITSCEQYSLFGIAFPWVILGYKRAAVECNELCSPGLGYTIPYPGMIGAFGKATVYVYDFRLPEIPADLTHPIVTGHFQGILNDIAEVDAHLSRQSTLVKSFTRGQLEQGTGFIGALLECQDDGIASFSACLLGTYDNKFVKLRITLPMQVGALEVIFGFVETIERILWPSASIGFNEVGSKDWSEVNR